MNLWRARALLLLLAAAFTASGLLFIPRLGIEVDEALVTAGIYPNASPWYSWRFGQDEVPVMLISYLGALKTWMYNVIFLFTPPRPMALRLPTLLAAAGSLWLFFALLDRTVGRRAAWIGTLMLATDSAYLLMNTVDYGPVTFQFVFKLAALLLLVRFHRSGQIPALAGAFFLFGVAMWDKAIFAWVLMGFAAAALAVFPREVRKHLSLRTLATAAGSMIAGALPLVIYNIARPLETFRSTVNAEQLAIWGKSVILEYSMNGSVLFGFMTALDPGPTPGESNHWYQSLSIAVAGALGQPRHSFTLYASAAAFLSLAILWRTPARRPILFAFVASVFTWLPMVLTAGAGAAAQHVLLIWPLHFIAIAAALDRIPGRAIAAAITTVLVAANLAVTNQYYADVIINGPTLRWTDAMDPLHRTLIDLGAPRIYVADWGIIETMNLLSEGSLPIRVADASNPEAASAMLGDEEAIFVAHPADIAFHPAERATLEEFAQREHYIEESIVTIHDRNGRPAFDVFRFRKLPL